MALFVVRFGGRCQHRNHARRQGRRTFHPPHDITQRTWRFGHIMDGILNAGFAHAIVPIVIQFHAHTQHARLTLQGDKRFCAFWFQGNHTIHSAGAIIFCAAICCVFRLPLQPLHPYRTAAAPSVSVAARYRPAVRAARAKIGYLKLAATMPQPARLIAS